MNLNLTLRSKVLEIALNTERNIDQLLIVFLTIENETRKAITNKSGGLQFNNKIDLLFDLEIFNRAEYEEFQLLMIFRNQFMHNLDCLSFDYAAEILGPDKKKRLLKFDRGQHKESEACLFDAYEALYQSTLVILNSKIKARRSDIDGRLDLLRNLLAHSRDLTDQHFETIRSLLVFCESNIPDQQEGINLMEKLRKFVANLGDELLARIGKLEAEHAEWITEERVKMLLKR